MAITLEQLSSDPQYREMTQHELTEVLGVMDLDGFKKLPGEWSWDKASNLLAKWASEPKPTQMLFEWVKYADRKPTDNKDYVILDEQESLVVLQYNVMEDRWIHYPDLLSEPYCGTVIFWLDGLTFQADEDIQPKRRKKVKP
jgi:hypothetical protein